MIAGKLLWVDCVGAALAGLAMVTQYRWLSRLYALPVQFVVGVGLVNLAYGAFSFSLAMRRNRPQGLITLLVAANATWASICLLMVAIVADQASPFGIAAMVLEGAYVGGLARAEWVHRSRLLTAL